MEKIILVDGRLLVNGKKETGISRYTKKIINFLITKYGVNNVLVLTNECIEDLECKQIRTSLKPFNPVSYVIFPFYLLFYKYDLFYSTHYSMPWVFNRKKNIATVHDLMFFCVKNFFKGGKVKNYFAKLYYYTLVKLSLNNSSRIIAVSKTTVKDIEEIYKLPSIHIREGLCLNNEENPEILEKLNLTKKNFFLYVGNNRNHKNIKFLIKTYKKFSNNNSPKLLIVGHQGVNENNVVYSGYVSDPELGYLYKTALKFIFPSIYEGFGLPILESIYNETPVVASDIPAFREFRSKNIEFFKLNDEISLKEAIFDKKQNFDRLDANKTLDYFSWEKAFFEIEFKVLNKGP